jgi:hypothetical protein
MDGFYGASCRFSPLARAVQDAAGGGGVEDLLLLFVGDESERFTGPFDGIRGELRLLSGAG